MGTPQMATSHHLLEPPALRANARFACRPGPSIRNRVWRCMGLGHSDTQYSPDTFWCRARITQHRLSARRPSRLGSMATASAEFYPGGVGIFLFGPRVKSPAEERLARSAGLRAYFYWPPCNNTTSSS